MGEGCLQYGEFFIRVGVDADRVNIAGFLEAPRVMFLYGLLAPGSRQADLIPPQLKSIVAIQFQLGGVSAPIMNVPTRN